MLQKRFISILLAAILCLLPFSISAWEPQENQVDLRVGIINDTHILPDEKKQGTAELKTALATFGTLAKNQLDGFLLVGDVVYYRYYDSDPTDPAPYNTFYEAWEEAGYNRSDILAYAMGNHEYPQGNLDPDVAAAVKATFTSQTGFETKHHTEKNGFHFIAIEPNDHDGYASEETQQWVMQEIDKALSESSTNDVDGVFPKGVIPNSTKPVFFMSHYPIDGTVFNAGGDRYSAEFESFLKSRPQVVSLTAHWHVAAQFPQTIWQGGFTAIQMPHMAVGNIKEYQATETGSIRGVSQGMMIEVSDDVVSVYKLDYNTGEFIGTPWIIDVPAIVADRLDESSENDYDHCLYSADKRTVSNAPVYPEGATLSVTPYEETAVITYPNNAVMTATGDGTQQDGFTRGYKVEVKTAGGTVVSSNTYQTDFYLPEESRAKSFTCTVEGLTPGTNYVAYVYPWSPLGTFGEPISRPFSTQGQKPSPMSVRYEFEKYFPETSIVKVSENASGGKIVSSNQSGMQTPAGVLPRDTENNPYTFSFDAELPKTDSYTINYAVGTHLGSTSVSVVTISVDGKEIGTNDTSYVKDLSLDKLYPWKYSPLMLYEKTGIPLTAGKHTVTVSIALPTLETKEQPFLFCTDYIEFTPETPVVAHGYQTHIEFEDYIDAIPEIKCTDGTIFTPEARDSSGASGLKYLWFDSETVDATVTAQIPVSLQVMHDASYQISYVGTDNTLVDVYLDEVSQSNLLSSTTTTEVLDEKNATSGLYPVFNTKHYAAKKCSFKADISQGAHQLIFVIKRRSSKKDIVQYLDCFDIAETPRTVSGITRIEWEDYASSFSPYKLSIKSSGNTSGGKYVYIDSDEEISHPQLTVDIPISVEAAGKYKLRYIASTVGTTPEIRANGVLLNAESQITEFDTFQNKKYQYFGEKNHAAKNVASYIELPAGEYNLEVTLSVRDKLNDVAICMDYLEIVPQDTITVVDGVATASAIYDNSVSGTAILALYNGDQMIATNTATASGTRTVSVSVPCASNFTHGKLFIWNDLENCIPVELVKELNMD